MTNVYLSGRFTLNTKIEKDWLKRTGCKHRCFSFAFMNETKLIPGFFNKKVCQAFKVCSDAKIKIMLDSGAYSTHAYSLKTSRMVGDTSKRLDIETLQKKWFDDYVKFCYLHKDKVTFYVTLDFKKNQPMIYDMQKQFQVKGLAPMPVYHGDSSLDWLSKHKDMGHNYICIGGLHLHKGKKGNKYYLEKVFNYGAKHGLVYHGLAMTSLDFIMTYPFKSVDSSTWSRTAAFGMLLLPDVRRRRFLNIHVSSRRSSNANTHHDMSKVQKDKLAEILKAHDFDLKAMKDSEIERHDWNGYVMSNLDKFGVTQQEKKRWGNLF
jgi:hypothetical protein